MTSTTATAPTMTAAEWRYRRNSVRQYIIAEARHIDISEAITAAAEPGVPAGWTLDLYRAVERGEVSMRRARQIVAEVTA